MERLRASMAYRVKAAQSFYEKYQSIRSHLAADVSGLPRALLRSHFRGHRAKALR